jgi:hypothetical protein
METSPMSPTTDSAKSRTVALPHVNKNILTGRQVAGKTTGAGLGADGSWNGMFFGPYLVPLSRRVE